MIKALIRIVPIVATMGALLMVSIACVKPPEPPPEPTPEPEVVNESPVINYVTCEKEVTPTAPVEITCVASDADGDTLSYDWSADEGDIEGEADIVTWTAPAEEGTYTVNVTVSDGKGGQASESVTIAVTPRPNNAPEVTLVVTPDGKEPITATPQMEPVRMKRWTTAQIQAVASDPDGDDLSFKWSATDGRLDGMGEEVTYLASETGDQTIVVTVTDSRGAETKTAAYVFVPCCGSQ